MNWKLIFQLSLFGLAMGIATVFVIPSKIEPAFWLAIFLICAYVIAKRCAAGHFLHGLLLWIGELYMDHGRACLAFRPVRCRSRAGGGNDAESLRPAFAQGHDGDRRAYHWTHLGSDPWSLRIRCRKADQELRSVCFQSERVAD